MSNRVTKRFENWSEAVCAERLLKRSLVTLHAYPHHRDLCLDIKAHLDRVSAMEADYNQQAGVNE